MYLDTARTTTTTRSSSNNDFHRRATTSSTSSRWGDVYRVVILILGWCGIALSILASVSTCEFLKYQISTKATTTTTPSSSQPSHQMSSSSLDPPFDRSVITGWVGIFQFSVLEYDTNATNQTDERIDVNSSSSSSSNRSEELQASSSNTTTTTTTTTNNNNNNNDSNSTQIAPKMSNNHNVGECAWYEQQFVGGALNNAFITTSQFCVVIAPSFAFIAMVLTTIESCCYFGIFRGSFVTMSILLLLASFLQSLTFLIFAEPTFCFNNNGCGVGRGGIYSACSAFAFFMSCLLLCCSPIPVPCLERYCYRSSSYSSSSRTNTSRNNHNNSNNYGRQEDRPQEDEPQNEKMQEDLEDPEEAAPTITATCTPTT